MVYQAENTWYGPKKWDILIVRKSGDEFWEHDKGHEDQNCTDYERKCCERNSFEW